MIGQFTFVEEWVIKWVVAWHIEWVFWQRFAAGIGRDTGGQRRRRAAQDGTAEAQLSASAPSVPGDISIALRLFLKTPAFVQWSLCGGLAPYKLLTYCAT